MNAVIIKARFLLAAIGLCLTWPVAQAQNPPPLSDLAGKVKMPYFHIDPLEIDLRAVTQVMSSEYAQRRSILPVEVNGREVTIATSEPFMASWEKELSEMLRLSIRRVLASPIDLERYHGEFFNLAKSMKRAESVGVQTSGLTNFEQLVELGKAGRQLDANDHHIVHLVNPSVAAQTHACRRRQAMAFRADPRHEVLFPLLGHAHRRSQGGPVVTGARRPASVRTTAVRRI